MSDQMKTYEAMFIVPAGQADFESAAEPVRAVLGRYDAQVLALKQWDERRLAYEISGQRRGLYVLTYFKIDPTRLREIEHDCQLDERILRILVLRRDHLPPEEIDAPTPHQTGHRLNFDEPREEEGDGRFRRRDDDRPRRYDDGREARSHEPSEPVSEEAHGEDAQAK